MTAANLLSLMDDDNYYLVLGVVVVVRVVRVVRVVVVVKVENICATSRGQLLQLLQPL
jgi:hypothetical protein